VNAWGCHPRRSLSASRTELGVEVRVFAGPHGDPAVAFGERDLRIVREAGYVAGVQDSGEHDHIVDDIENQIAGLGWIKARC
jgi:hypothetical protein